MNERPVQPAPPPLRIWWDGVKMYATAGITIDEVNGCILRLKALRDQLEEQDAKTIHQLPAPKLILPK